MQIRLVHVCSRLIQGLIGANSKVGCWLANVDRHEYRVAYK